MRCKRGLARGIVLALSVLIMQVVGVGDVRGAPVGTAFTYQGELKQNGVPVNAACNFQFTAFDAASGGSQVGSVQTVPNVTVSNGLFTAFPIDFGASAYANTLWVQIVATCPAGSGSPTTFPRQRLTPAPNAVFASTAGSATTAVAFTGTLVGDVIGTQGENLVSKVGGQTAANVAAGVLRANAGTSASVPNTLVARDSSSAINVSSISTGTISTASVTSPVNDLNLYAGGQPALWVKFPGCGTTCGPSMISGYFANNPGSGLGVTIGGGGRSASGLDGPNKALSDFTTVSGGSNNTAGSNAPGSNGAYATVMGGRGNIASTVGDVAGGLENQVSGGASVGFGFNNVASGATSTAIGNSNHATSQGSLAIGNSNGATANYSTALGTQASTNGHLGAIVISDGSSTSGSSTTPVCDATVNATMCAQNDYEFRLRATGGIRLRTSPDASAAPGANSNTGCDLPPGSGTFSCSSSRELKADFGAIDPRAILKALDSLPIQTWRFKGEEPTLRHVGPVAEDFAAVFPLGQDDRAITMSDEQGVALAAIQGLYQIVREQGTTLARIQTEKDAVIAEQVTQMADLKEEVAALRTRQEVQQQDFAARLAALERKVEP